MVVIVLTDSHIPEVKMRPSAKSDPKRRRGVSIEATRLRKRARMLIRMVEYLERVDEVEDYDTEGSVVPQGTQGAEVIEVWDRDSDVSVSTPHCLVISAEK